jgi:hypothetical protein
MTKHEDTTQPAAFVAPFERELGPRREAFERYFLASRKGRGPSKAPTFAKLGDGTYADDHTQRHWWTWKQAAEFEGERMRPLTFCGCGDQFTAHDPGTCGACVAGMTCAPGWNPGA